MSVVPSCPTRRSASQAVSASTIAGAAYAQSASLTLSARRRITARTSTCPPSRTSAPHTAEVFASSQLSVEAIAQFAAGVSLVRRDSDK